MIHPQQELINAILHANADWLYEKKVNLTYSNLCGSRISDYTYLLVFGVGEGRYPLLYIPEADVVIYHEFKGTMAQFEDCVNKQVPNEHLEAYKNTIEYLKKQAQIYRKR